MALFVAFESEARTTAGSRPAGRLIPARGAPKEHARSLDLQKRIVTVQTADSALNRTRGSVPEAAQQVPWRRCSDGVRRNVLEIRRHMVTRSLFGLPVKTLARPPGFHRLHAFSHSESNPLPNLSSGGK